MSVTPYGGSGNAAVENLRSRLGRDAPDSLVGGGPAIQYDITHGYSGIEAQLPLYIFIFLVALGVDYNIFLSARIREEARQIGTRPATPRPGPGAPGDSPGRSLDSPGGSIEHS